MRLGKLRKLGVAHLAGDVLGFLVPSVTYPLKEEEREDVGLEIRRVNRAAQDIG